MLVVNSRFLTQDITGVQRFAIEICRHLKKMIPDIEFVTPNKIIHKELAEELEAKTIGSFTGHLWEQVDLFYYLKTNKNPLLLNLANTGPIIYKNQIIVIHDIAFYKYPEFYSKKFNYYYRFLTSIIVKRCQYIFTVSDYSKEEIINTLKVSKEKIGVIYNAVSQDFININQSQGDNIYGDFILAVSSLNPKKNFHRLLLSFEKLKLENVKLVIVGAKYKSFPDNNLETIIRSNKNIVFTGHINEVKKIIDLYQNAKLFVYPSLYESFGIPPIEAMACGCPVVTSNIAAIPEICQDAVYYIDPYDVDSISDGISNVLYNNELRSELRNKGYENIKRFDWSISSNKIVEIVNKIQN